MSVFLSWAWDALHVVVWALLIALGLFLFSAFVGHFTGFGAVDDPRK